MDILDPHKYCEMLTRQRLPHNAASDLTYLSIEELNGAKPIPSYNIDMMPYFLKIDVPRELRGFGPTNESGRRVYNAHRTA